ncbi:MAG: hypothetical protein K2P58_04165 [Hyphomonadaceae bacterium]|nr:hypothetical protein [Hyphomonadaceae bacterium]
MQSPRTAIALSALALAGCAGGGPPQELAGLWSAGPASCDAGVGVRFEADAIEAVYDQQVETLFARPRYEIEANGDAFRVRIAYDLPRIAGAVRSPNQHGVLVLARQPDGGLAPETHALVDPRTGATRTRIAGDPVETLMTLHPCGEHPWLGGLRGRA